MAPKPEVVPPERETKRVTISPAPVHWKSRDSDFQTPWEVISTSITRSLKDCSLATSIFTGRLVISLSDE